MRRRSVIGVLVLVVSLAAAACGPTGRYIDEVFPAVDRDP
jgi:hypothetical protein